MREVSEFLKVSLCDVSELFTHFTKLSVHGILWCGRKIINLSLLAYYYMVAEQVIFPGHYEDDM